mmetsp:Transcript_22158/g.53030  ORF Transcript_22158/g.53030 Transcript_22158/m.53030 type:complete len:634 (-) Transcript_22158:466-2367(-)
MLFQPRVLESGLCGGPLLGVNAQEGGEEVEEALIALGDAPLEGGHLWAEDLVLPRRGGLFIQVPAPGEVLRRIPAPLEHVLRDVPEDPDHPREEGCQAHVLEQHVPRCELREYAPEGPDVDPLVVLHAQDHLGGAVAPRLHVAREVVRREAAGPQVDHLHLAPRIALDEDVLRLEVSVDDADEVQVLQRQEHLRHVEADVGLLQPLLRLRVEERVQLAAAADLQDEVQVARRLEGAVERRQEGVVDGGEDVCLGHHAGHLVALDHLPLVEGLHRKLEPRADEGNEVDEADVPAAELLLTLEVRDLDAPVLGLDGAQRREGLVLALVRLPVDLTGLEVLPGVGVHGRAHAHVLQRLLDDRAGRRALGGDARVCHERHLARREVPLRGGGDVDLDADHEAAGPVDVADRREGEHVPERPPLLGVVEDPDSELLPVLDGLADLVHDPLVGLRALQEAAVAAEHLLAAVPGELQEGVRGEDDGAVRQCRVGDAEVLLDALHGGGEVERHAGEGLGRRPAALVLDLLDRVHDLRHDLVRHVLLEAVVVLHEEGNPRAVRKGLPLGPAGDVHLDADKLCDLPRRGLHRRDREEVPEGRPVLAVVQQADRANFALLHRAPDLGDLLGVRALALQEPAVVP